MQFHWLKFLSRWCEKFQAVVRWYQCHSHSAKKISSECHPISVVRWNFIAKLKFFPSTRAFFELGAQPNRVRKHMSSLDAELSPCITVDCPFTGWHSLMAFPQTPALTTFAVSTSVAKYLVKFFLHPAELFSSRWHFFRRPRYFVISGKASKFIFQRLSPSTVI